MKRFLIITGMHRSGTSFLARALNMVGVYLGEFDDLISHEWSPSQDNLRGHWEHKKFLELTEQTLQLNNGSWHDIPEKIVIPDELGLKIREYVKNLTQDSHLVVGFKDPRILLCLDSWLKYLPNDFVLVGIFRNPLKVAESLKNRNNFDYEKSLTLWKIYNQNLLNYLEKYDGFLLDFDWSKQKLLSELSSIASKLGLVKNIDLSSWYDEELLHSDKTYKSNFLLPNDIESIYLKLKIRSENNIHIGEQNFHMNEKYLIINELIQRLLKESVYFTLNEKNSETITDKSKVNHINSLKTLMFEINNLGKTHLETQKMLEKYDKIIEEKNNELTNLRTSLENTQKMIMDIHQSFVFRMLRKYDNSVGKLLPIRPKQYLKSQQQEDSIDEQLSIKKRILAHTPLKKDIICFPIINWDYRYQRPQHIIRKFAENGHRVFYLTASLRPLKKTYEIRTIADNIYQIELNSPRYFDIYKDKFHESLISELINSFKLLCNDLKIDALSLVMFPTWTPLVMRIKKLFGFPIISDYLDDFHNFPNVHSERKKEEKTLISNSDLVIASSSSLFKNALQLTQNVILVPNGGEFEHFNRLNLENPLQIHNPIIGYFGSIAEWFDTQLIEFIAKKRPDISFVFIGHTYGSDVRKLTQLPNVHFLGERPYSELPKYLHRFDVCLIPFKITPLIEATHPVKIYEYMAAGKPVVVTKMPELESMQHLCYIAEDNEDFLKKIDLALKEDNPDLVKKRIEFASKNTWMDRFNVIYSKLNELPALDLFHHTK